MISAIKGMNDVRPRASDPFLDSAVWDRIFSAAARVIGSYGYHRVFLPSVEETALFARGIGEDTDIVSKEMYSFEDRGGRKLTLRPEGTAGAVRAYVQHNLGRNDPMQRWWYGGPMFRAERPQKGRYRQFYQIGAELFGSAEPAADAELMIMLSRFVDELGISNVRIRINSLGDGETRRAYREALRAYLEGCGDALCESCRGRLSTNPLRVLDCKRPDCKAAAANAPDILHVMTATARQHFDSVIELAGAQGVACDRDRHLVRGLDYYTGTIFEFTTGALGAQDALLGGGRYDDLVAELGGPATPAVGFAAGVERLALLVAAQQEGGDATGALKLYVIPMGEAVVARAFALAQEVRDLSGVGVEVDVGGGRLKHQMKRADRAGAEHALVLGEDELRSGRATLKNLKGSAGVQAELTAAGLCSALTLIK